jgi:hypothetical protein
MDTQDLIKILESHSVSKIADLMLGPEFHNSRYSNPNEYKCIVCEKSVSKSDAINIDGVYACSPEHAIVVERINKRKRNKFLALESYSQKDLEDE